MTLLEEITERRKAFHNRIAVQAANLAKPQPSAACFVPAPPREASLSFAALPVVSKYRIDATYEAIWSNVVCGCNDVVFVSGALGRFKAIKRAVCDNYCFSEQVFISKRRQRELAEARQVAMYLGKHHTELSYPHIGRLLGGRDHTTVLHGVRKITNLRENDSLMNARIELLELRLGLRADGK